MKYAFPTRSTNHTREQIETNHYIYHNVSDEVFQSKKLNRQHHSMLVALIYIYIF